MREKFSVPNDRVVKIVSNGALIVSLLLLFDIVHNGLNTTTIPLSLLIPIIGVAWLFHPSGYILDENKLQIRRPIGNISIPYQNISNVEYISEEELVPYSRLFGCGGLFGYFGTYISKKIGRFNMWIANKDNIVIIAENNERLTLISPSDTDGFVAFLTRNISLEGPTN